MTETFAVSSLPDKPIDTDLFLDVIGDTEFCLIYDFAARQTLLSFPDKSTARLISAALPGLGLEKSNLHVDASGYALSLYRSVESIGPNFLSDIFDSGIACGRLIVIFCREAYDSIAKEKVRIEKRLGELSRNTGYSISESGIGARVSKSAQGKDFAGSEEAALLYEVLENLNRSMLKNGCVYKILFIASDDSVRDYISSRTIVINSNPFEGSIETALEYVSKAKLVPFGYEFAKCLINFRGCHSTSHIIEVNEGAVAEGGLPVGTFLKNSVYDTGRVVRIDAGLLNLGFIISGLPGSGKTRASMSILDGVRDCSASTKMIVISPTDEWDAFALQHGMYLVRLCSDKLPINFFRCPDNANLSSFYESLAMILASAAAAGPYRNPIEKCLLNAFGRVYSETREPDPAAVFNEIEESIIAMHGKRTNVGVKYTKHGENIKSSLENLKKILVMPEYSVAQGIKIEDLLGRGAVFDLSHSGIGTRSHFYALLLNQVYSIADSLDSNGDGQLRLLICMEEAQMMLKDPKSPVVEDIRYRIQDFRKRGVGLLLLAHNTSDIETGIRRLCQLKLYLKQAADVAEAAASDLVFTNVEEEEVAAKLKHMDARIGALSFVSRDGNLKIAHDAIFIRTLDCPDATAILDNPIEEYRRLHGLQAPKEMRVKINVRCDGCRIRLSYLDDTVLDCDAPKGRGMTHWLVRGRRYRADLLNEKGRVVYSANVTASKIIDIG
ncbi:hypothetical protein M1397_00240 [Candidatus Marsarchaeota archaeon]|nr:hypothetical protein [Candidatus Marsarchaeota archaeon]